MTLIELIKFTDIDSFKHQVPRRSKVYPVVILRGYVDGESGRRTPADSELSAFSIAHYLFSIYDNEFRFSVAEQTYKYGHADSKL